MLIFFDTEFSGLQKDTQLISIGLISENDKRFYAEFGDINTEVLDDWIKENVLANTVKYGGKEITDIVPNEYEYHFGTKEEIKEQLTEWLSQFDNIQLVSDVCHYDMVLFIDIFGTAFDLPETVNASCHDINQDIALARLITEKEAFDLNREDLLEEYGISIVGDKHNSMTDATVIQSLYAILQRGI